VLVVFQPVLSVHSVPLVLVYKATSASHSLCGIWVTSAQFVWTCAGGVGVGVRSASSAIITSVTIPVRLFITISLFSVPSNIQNVQARPTRRLIVGQVW
jgi:hypothetical protein